MLKVVATNNTPQCKTEETLINSVQKAIVVFCAVKSHLLYGISKTKEVPGVFLFYCDFVFHINFIVLISQYFQWTFPIAFPEESQFRQDRPTLSFNFT